jgi:hypothetical protein
LVFSYDWEDTICTFNFGALASKNLHSEGSLSTSLKSANNAKPSPGEKYSKPWRQLEPVLCTVTSGEL